MSEFIPKGFVGLPKAIWYLSITFDPDLWSKEIPQDPREFRVWMHLIDNLDAQWLEDRIRYPFFVDGQKMPDAAVERIASYYEAERKLREALYAGDLTAYFVSASEAENGKLLPILREGWGADAGQIILWAGRADISGEPRSRVVFIDAYSMKLHFFGDKGTETTNDAGSSITKPEVPANSQMAIYRTGAQGRPSAMHFLVPEAQRRADADEVPSSRGLFNEQLAQWLNDAHPDAPKTTAKSIGNNPMVTEIYRRVQARRKKATPDT